MAASSALPPLPPPPHTYAAAAASIPPPTLKTPTIRSRLSKLCQEGQPHLARQLFDTIPRPSTALWNTLIIGFICNHMPQQALLFYSQMKNSAPAIRFDSYTYSSTLKACAEARSLKLGKALHCHFVRCERNPSRIVYNSLLNMYATCLSATESEMGSFLGFRELKYDLVRTVFNMMPKRNVVAWNTLVAWYVRTERYGEAIRQFRMMIKTGIRPSPVSFVNVFPAASSGGRIKLANVLYGLVLKSGHEFVDDLYVVSSAIFMYAELGCPDIARKIFDLCLEKSTEVWNTMIAAYVQNNSPVDGIKVFVEALMSAQTDLDDVTMVSALTAVSQMQELDLALQFHAYAIKKCSELPVNVLNTIIAMYSRCGFVETSFKIFDRMLERDTVSWNTMISAFVQNGLDDEGLLLAYEMQRQGLTADPVTLTALLSAASNLKDGRVGKQIHAYLLRHALQFEGMGSYLIDMYAKCGSISNARNVFDSNYMSDRDLATWNAMISGYAQNGLAEEVFATLRQMLDNSLNPNAITVASVLPACNALGNLSFGKQVHGFSIRHLLHQNVFVGTALVDMYSKLGVIKDAENVFSMTTEKNSVTYTTMIQGYGQHGMGEKSLSLFLSMRHLGIEPDAITFVAVLSACSHAGLVDEGFKILMSMESEYNIKPWIEHFCCIADMLGRVGRVYEAFEFFNDLGEDANNLAIWGSLLGACRTHRQLELAEQICKKLDKMGMEKNVSGYKVLLSNMYADQGNWDSVNRLREEMREKGLRKDVGQSWIDFKGTVNYFGSRDQKHQQRDEIYDMLAGLAMEMRDAGYRPSLDSSFHEIYEIDE
ncbi:hypothetical protein CDL15_Pgr015270 [Punica granatum]|uniref:Pentatricopeptide repeat-containing protein At3g22150, chloroplastic n=1 Tax=Punica granatum TaxID=22663 RepID=A0A218VZC4_PUNGR|nr:hypothetical protein CDL15_Pgr015270 [Punica granatum]